MPRSTLHPPESEAPTQIMRTGPSPIPAMYFFAVLFPIVGVILAIRRFSKQDLGNGFGLLVTSVVTVLMLWLLLALAATADAKDLVAHRLRVPTNVRIHETPCPVAGTTPTCAIPGGTTFAEPGDVYIDLSSTPRGSDLYRFDYWHEVGTFAQQWLSDGERNRITSLVGLPGFPWRGGTWGSAGNGQHSPEQRFEDSYSLCQLGWYADESIGTPSPYGLALSHRQMRQLCGTIRRATGLD